MCFLFSFTASAADWSKDAKLPGNQKCKTHHGKMHCYRDGNRANIYNIKNLDKVSFEGSAHALQYPVTASDLKISADNMKMFFDEKTDSPIRKFIFKIAKKLSRFKSFNHFYEWLGLTKNPESLNDQGPNPIKLSQKDKDLKTHLGVSVYHQGNERALTFSCAACHSADLFGTKILGMTTRFSKANEVFKLGKSALSNTPSLIYKQLFLANDEQMKIFKAAKKAVRYVEQKEPLVLGLDTSLAQVGLSLSRRANDEYASRNKMNAYFPRANKLENVPADSKPAVWWNVKYKTRWLSDGSIISGNPVHTNFLWNEIGRGTDLKKLEKWLSNNIKKIKELTTFVFNTKAPKYEDFFPGQININKAKRGEKLFLKTCSGCHGEYEKGWSNHSLSYEDQIKTTKIWSHEKTPVIDVKTDPYRYQGMNYFYKDLNRLKISTSLKTVVRPSKGYVPPPLVGIWARYPYFHNNSAPSLYEVITPEFKRVTSYIAVPSENKKTDFDKRKNGYPKEDFIREPFKSNKDYYYNTKIKGLSNSGHTRMLLDNNGREKFTERQKYEIIEFLKTL
jgi:cytochrome c peroxidase